MGLLKNKKTLMVGGVILALGVVVYMFGGKLLGNLPTFSASTDATEQMAATSQSIEKELIDELLNLQSIVLDRTPIDSNAYRSLEDFSHPIDLEPVGRPNPFLPFSSSESEGQ